MGKIMIILSVVVFTIQTTIAQSVYKTNLGTITFFSSAPLEDIKATNKKVKADLNSESGEILIKLRIEDFQFRKSLMQEHFNETYMESHIYAESQFKGKIIGFNKSLLKVTPTTFIVEGDLTMHGVTKKIKTNATIQIDKEKLVCETIFQVKIVDYNIKVPSLLIKNIAEVVEITANLSLTK
jgi:polyisoprenoid-binding protein YceI